MGKFDLTKSGTSGQETRSALDAARDAPADDGTVTRLVQKLLDLGLDGLGPLSSAETFARQALTKTGSPEAAVAKIGRTTLVRSGIGGFATGLGGFITMPVALPLNILEFYVQATRMVGAIAVLRGYDVDDPQIRTAVLLTLVGSDADEVLRRAGIATGSGKIAGLATRNLPPAALMIANKAIGFNLIKSVGEKAVARLGRGVPLAGGVIGAGVDAWMMKRIADQAMEEFPQV